MYVKPKWLRLVCASCAFAALGLRGVGSSGDELRARLATAGPGATIEVAAGEYDGPFVIDRPVRLRGASGAVLRGGGKGHVIAVRAPDVEIAGFVIRDSGVSLEDDHAGVHIGAPRAFVHHNEVVNTLHGIYVRGGNDCRLTDNVIRGAGSADEIRSNLPGRLRPGDDELCAANLTQDQRGNGIHLWSSSGHVITGNDISGMRDGIYFSFTDNTEVRHNRFRRLRYGLHYMYSDGNVFADNTFTESAAGAALMYSRNLVLRDNRFVANRSHRAYGVLLQSVDDTLLEGNEISGNTLGLFLENTNACTLTRNRLTGNYIAVRLSDSSRGNRFFENVFARNLHPVETNGRNAANDWSAGGRGNHWEDALDLDLNRDGVADVPHREADLFGAWRRTFPAIGLLSGSPAERLLRFVHARVRLPGIPGVSDPAPLVRGNRPTADGGKPRFVGVGTERIPARDRRVHVGASLDDARVRERAPTSSAPTANHRVSWEDGAKIRLPDRGSPISDTP